MVSDKMLVRGVVSGRSSAIVLFIAWPPISFTTIISLVSRLKYANIFIRQSRSVYVTLKVQLVIYSLHFISKYR